MPLINIDNCEEEYGRSVQLPKCNREACTETFAPCYNRGTNTYYCYECARDMNVCKAWDEEQNGPLCQIPERSVLHEMEIKCFAGEQYVGTRKLEDIPELWAEAKKRMPDMGGEQLRHSRAVSKYYNTRRAPDWSLEDTNVYTMPAKTPNAYVVYIKTLFDADADSLRAQILATPGIVPVEEKRRRPDSRVFLVGVLNDEAVAAVKAIEGVTISPRRTYTIS